MFQSALFNWVAYSNSSIKISLTLSKHHYLPWWNGEKLAQLPFLLRNSKNQKKWSFCRLISLPEKKENTQAKD